MTSPTFAFITPSYTPDFERCKLLCETIDHFAVPLIPHYVIVGQNDLPLFQPLAKPHRHILTVESILPWWILKVHVLKKVWLSLKTVPIRNWLMQQIVKITMAQQIAEDVAIFVDSDVVFVRPFDCQTLVKNGQVFLFRNPDGNEEQRQMHLKWHQTASNLFGLEQIEPMIPDYISQIITWRKENAIKMCQKIEAVTGKNWIEALANSWHVSEYVLYGIFVTQVLQETSGHYWEATNFCHNYWLEQPLSKSELEKFLGTIEDHHVAVMLSAKAGISVDQYQDLIQEAIH